MNYKLNNVPFEKAKCNSNGIYVVNYQSRRYNASIKTQEGDIALMQLKPSRGPVIEVFADEMYFFSHPSNNVPC